MGRVNLLCLAGAALTLLASNVDAQYVQNALAVPIAPGCSAGESWTKNGVRYQCETPQPSCANGFASGPVWSGSAWIYTCNAPPPPPTPPSVTPPRSGGPTLDDLCAARAAQLGFPSLGPDGPVIGQQYNTIFQHNYYQATGPLYNDGIDPPTTSWTVTCTFTASGAWVPDSDNPFVAQPNTNNCPGCGGGT
jgi:hypothetical protein